MLELIFSVLSDEQENSFPRFFFYVNNHFIFDSQYPVIKLLLFAPPFLTLDYSRYYKLRLFLLIVGLL